MSLSIFNIFHGILGHDPPPLTDPNSVAGVAIGAVGTIATVAATVLTVMAVIVGIITLVGFSAVQRAARRQAKTVAKRSVNDYLESPEFADELKKRFDAINRQAVEKRAAADIVIGPQEDDADPFPKAGRKGGPGYDP